MNDDKRETVTYSDFNIYFKVKEKLRWYDLEDPDADYDIDLLGLKRYIDYHKLRDFETPFLEMLKSVITRELEKREEHEVETYE
jgi:hypothetical protein